MRCSYVYLSAYNNVYFLEDEENMEEEEEDDDTDPMSEVRFVPSDKTTCTYLGM